MSALQAVNLEESTVLTVLGVALAIERLVVSPVAKRATGDESQRAVAAQ